MHKALYRKWRPMVFDDVCGQEHITSVLRYQVESEKLSHAYLFCGSRGTGKTTCAKILAKAVNCESPVNGNPCGKCHACLDIENGSVTDVIEMDAASNNSVEDVRSIRNDVVYAPSSVQYHVYIIDEVHMLSSSAFNALLKTLEEPPPHVIFILATTELQKLPATIISRCQRFDFRRITIPVISSRLEYISSEENIKIEKDACALIAKLSQGGMRDAISMLELCAGDIAGAPSGIVTAETVGKTAGIAGRDSLSDMIKAILKGDIEAAFEIIRLLYNSSRDIGIFCQDLIAFYRDMLIIKSCNNAKSFLDLTDTEYSETGELAKSIRREKISFHLSIMHKALADMQRSGMSKRLCAELAVVKMTDSSLSGKDSEIEALSDRIVKLEDSLITLHSTGNQTGTEADSAAQKEKNTRAPASETPVETITAPNKSVPTHRTEKKFAETVKKNTDGIFPRTLRTVGYWSEVIADYDRYDKSKTELFRMTKAYRASDGILVVKTYESFIFIMINTNEVRDRLLICASKYDRDIANILIEKIDDPAKETDLIDEIEESAGPAVEAEE